MTVLFVGVVFSVEKLDQQTPHISATKNESVKSKPGYLRGNAQARIVPGAIVSTRQKKNGTSEEFFLEVVKVSDSWATVKNAPNAYPFIDPPGKTAQIPISQLKIESPLKVDGRIRKQKIAKSEAEANRKRAQHLEDHARYQKEQRTKPIEGVRFATDEIREREKKKNATGCSISQVECKKRCNLDWGALQMCTAQCDANHKNCLKSNR